MSVLTRKILPRLVLMSLSYSCLTFAAPTLAAVTRQTKKGFKIPPKKNGKVDKAEGIKTKGATDVTDVAKIEDIIEPEIDFQFVSFGKDDPFLPPMTINEDGSLKSLDVLHAAKKEKKAGDFEKAIVSPLQKYDLRKIKVIGIWQLSSGERKAMVRVDKQIGGGSEAFVIGKGSLIGNQFGKVIGISSDKITVREFVILHNGKEHYINTDKYLGDKGPKSKNEVLVAKPGEKGTKVVDKNAEETFDEVLEKDRKAKEAKEKLEEERRNNPNKFRNEQQKAAQKKATEQKPKDVEEADKLGELGKEIKEAVLKDDAAIDEKNKALPEENQDAEDGGER